MYLRETDCSTHTSLMLQEDMFGMQVSQGRARGGARGVCQRQGEAGLTDQDTV
jgi:hypothetical protein